MAEPVTVKKPDFLMYGSTDQFRLRMNPSESPDPTVTAEQMPGQCGILVIYGLSAKTPKDLATLILKAQHVAEQDGYPWLVASTVSQQKVAERFFAADGWDPFWSFPNLRTNNLVTMWRKKLDNATPLIHRTRGE